MHSQRCVCVLSSYIGARRENQTSFRRTGLLVEELGVLKASSVLHSLIQHGAKLWRRATQENLHLTNCDIHICPHLKCTRTQQQQETLTNIESYHVNICHVIHFIIKVPVHASQYFSVVTMTLIFKL